MGLFLASPAISADAKWRSAGLSRNLQNLENSLVPSFMNPASSFKYLQAVDILDRSAMPDLAIRYSRIGVKFNQDYFDGWLQLYLLTNATAEDKATALANMKRLDPLNPDVTKR
jgi:hypothetical protein